jgi:protein involved in polysaccharide export with SLBB domain
LASPAIVAEVFGGSFTRNRYPQGVKLVQAKQVPLQSQRATRHASQRAPQRAHSAVAVLFLALIASLTASLSAQAPGGGGGAAAPAAAATSTVSGQAASAAGDHSAVESDSAARDNRRESTERRVEVPAGSQDTRTEFQQMVEATTGRRLPIYGASLFTGVPKTFAPVDDVPVGPGYVLGPGDEIHLQMSGQVNQQIRFTIDRTGSISLPGVGAVHLAGMPYSELNPFLTQQLGKLYKNFTVNATLGALRTIQVFVVGQATRPGTYSISSLSTLTNAIFASGGPAPQGSVRDIQVKRGGVTIDHFDLYDLLLYGDKTRDVALMTGDVIFIPFVGPQVAIVGSVDNPAIYELKGNTTVDQALKLAGGDTPVAAGATVRVERIFEHSMRSVTDVTADGKSTVLVQNGDIISVTSVIDRFRDAVTLRGNVANPGRYVFHPGMRISDLIPNKEALITRNYWRKRNQLGQLVQDYEPDQPDATAHGEGALEVHGNAADRRADPNNRGGATTDAGGSSVGAALTANNGPFGAQTDVVLSAPDIDWNYAVIERQSTVDLTTSLIPFNLGDIVLNHNAAQNFELLPGDVITIFSKSDIRVPSNQQTRYVRLEGEFNASGVYSVLPGETLRGLIRRVGGFTSDAYLYGSEFTRESTRRVETQRLHEYADQLSAQISEVTSSNIARATSPSDQLAASASEADARSAVQRLRSVQPLGRIVLNVKPDSTGIDAVDDLPLEDGDRFVVPRVPANVTVEGQVYNANAFVYAPRERMIDYLERAGGPDREADRKRMFILRADGSVFSHQYGNVEHAPMYPGDTIVVPPVIDKRSVLQRVVSIASAVGNFGLGAAAIYLISRN